MSETLLPILICIFSVFGSYWNSSEKGVRAREQYLQVIQPSAPIIKRRRKKLIVLMDSSAESLYRVKFIGARRTVELTSLRRRLQTSRFKKGLWGVSYQIESRTDPSIQASPLSVFAWFEWNKLS